MIPRFFPALFAFVLVCAAPSLTSVRGQEGRPLVSEKVLTFAAADNVNELCVAVMGEVDTPGTYRLDSSSLKLHRVIQCARGFTADASMAIRVIRSGRARQTEIFSEKTDSRLMPGDLLVVESKRRAASGGKIAESTRDSQTIRANYQEGTIRSGVQIALLNVVDYPLVLRLRPDQANATFLVQALGQPISLLATTRVITPDIPRRQTSDMAKSAPRMDDGSVMIFEPGKINRNRLPVTLPKPINTEITAGSHVGLIGSRNHHSPDLRNLGHHPFWSSSDPFDSNARMMPDTTVMMNDQSGEIPNVLEVEMGSESHVATIESPDSDLQGTGQNLDGEESREDSHSLLMPIGPPLSSDDPIDAEPVELSIAELLLIFIVAASLVGAALLIRSALERKALKRKPLFEMDAAEEIPPVESVARTEVSNQTTDDTWTEDATTEITDAHEMMTIPIRQHTVFGSGRPEPIVSVRIHEAVNEQSVAPDNDPAPTPLAKALLQLEQRRSA